MKRLAAALVIMSAMVGLWGCGDSEPWGLDTDIVGTWIESNPTSYPYFQVLFNADGSVVFWHSRYGAYSAGGAWHTEDTTVVISLPGRDYSDVYQYSQVGDRLTLTTVDGYDIHCIRKQ